MLDADGTLGDMDEAPDELQRQRAQAMALRQLGQLGQISGDRVLGTVGAGLEQQAQQSDQFARQQRHEDILSKRYDAMAQQAAAANARKLQEQQDAENGVGRYAKGFTGLQTPDGKTMTLDKGTGEVAVVNTATKRLGKGTGAPKLNPDGTPAVSLNPKEEALWRNLEAGINPSTGRSGEMGKNQGRINTADRALGLVVDPTTGAVRNLDKREVTELATTLQSLLSPGGHSAGEVEHLIPVTWQGNVQGYLEKLTNEPNGLGMQKFVEKMRHTVEREKAVSTGALRAAQYGVLPGLGTALSKKDRKRFDATIRAQGLDPSELDENLLRLEKKQAAAPGHGAGPSAAPAPAAQDPGRRTIGGKTYVKLNGEWHEEGS